MMSMMGKASLVSMVRMGSLLELFMLAHTMKYLGFDQRFILRTQISPVTLFSSLWFAPEFPLLFFPFE